MEIQFLGGVKEGSYFPWDKDDVFARKISEYYVNGGVLVPAFGCEEDDIVFDKFKQIFSDRKVEQIYSREPLLGGGDIHCILHEIPELR